MLRILLRADAEETTHEREERTSGRVLELTIIIGEMFRMSPAASSFFFLPSFLSRQIRQSVPELLVMLRHSVETARF